MQVSFFSNASWNIQQKTRWLASHVKKYSKYDFVFGALKRQLTNALFCVYSKCDPNE